MQRDVWKWVLQEMTDDMFYTLVAESEIVIPGFRNNRRMDQNMVKRLKPRIITALFKPGALAEVQETFSHMFQEMDSPYMTMSKEELLSEMMDREKVFHVLSILLSAACEEKEKLAGELYAVRLSDEGGVIKQEEPKEKVLQRIIRELEQKVKKQESKLAIYIKRCAAMEQDIEGKTKVIKRQEAEQQQMKQQLHRVKMERHTYAVRCEEQQSTIQELQMELQEKRREAAEQAELIEKQRQEVNRLHARCLHLSSSEKEAAAGVLLPNKLAIIGNIILPHLPDGSRLFSKDTLPQAIEQQELLSYQYICLAQFSMTPANLRKVKRAVPEERIKKFYNMQQLQQFLQQEGSV